MRQLRSPKCRGDRGDRPYRPYKNVSFLFEQDLRNDTIYRGNRVPLRKSYYTNHCVGFRSRAAPYNFKADC
ncbi:MAG: hypothetical protein F6J93_20535 [Oscillatoria sp. SIO1A7]|nr:hypothetical protein [Oscillatoria sp. SIO1A7]